MWYRLAADAVVLVHLAFVLFVVLGGFLAWRWPRLLWIHLPSAVWGALIEFTKGVCPLTPLENTFRRLAGDAGYDTGFVEHYVLPVLYPVSLTPALQIILGILVVLVNAVAYSVYFNRRRRRRHESDPQE